MQPVVNADLLRTFKPPHELARSRPREVRLTASGKLLVTVAWVLAATAIVVTAGLHGEARADAMAAAQMDERGVSTTATIDRLWRTSGEGKHPYAAFHFDANGTRVDAQARMQSSRWRALRVGAGLPVRYLPDNPRDFLLDGARRDRMPPALPYVLGGLIAIGAFLCAAGVTSQRRLLMEGRPAPAVVTEVKKHHAGHGATHRVMTYQFPLLGGGVATGKAQALTKSTDVGATICIVYDPDVPRRSRPYPFSLAKVETG